MSITEAQTIDTCRKMLANQQELDALVERDPYTPDGGPNHARHQALLSEHAALAAALIKAAPPTTLEGIQALAQAAMLFTDHEGNSVAPGELWPTAPTDCASQCSRKRSDGATGQSTRLADAALKSEQLLHWEASAAVGRRADCGGVGGAIGYCCDTTQPEMYVRVVATLNANIQRCEFRLWQFHASEHA